MIYNLYLFHVWEICNNFKANYIKNKDTLDDNFLIL